MQSTRMPSESEAAETRASEFFENCPDLLTERCMVGQFGYKRKEYRFGVETVRNPVEVDYIAE